MNTFTDNGCYGHCPNCDRTHRLGLGGSLDYARELMATLRSEDRLDIDVPYPQRNPNLALSVLFPGDRGHMFGVLECENNEGETVWLKAFSSLRGGIRFVPGWVRPNLSQKVYDTVVKPQEANIKAISRVWSAESDPIKKTRLAKERAELSQNLWRQMLSLYRFNNFRGQVATIPQLFGDRGVPGGVGECCAPKLLCAAAHQNLTPKGLCEFYWGPRTTYQGKTSGTFYPCCEQRCRLLLGFILCGIEVSEETACAPDIRCASTNTADCTC